MFRAILVDDEKPTLDLLKLMLERSGQVLIAGSYQNPEEAFLNIAKDPPDVVFLDIEMPGINGIELAGKIVDAKINSEIIFVTAYDNYALEAFRVNAIEYMLKPYDATDIANALAKLKKVKPGPQAPEASNGHAWIQTFGRLSLQGPGSTATVTWRTTKTEELFAYLMTNLDRFVSKRRIVEALWPDGCSEKQITTNLHTSIYQVKKTLLQAKIPFEILYQNGSYRLSLPAAEIDSLEFNRLIDEAQLALDLTMVVYKQAVELYAGHYLEENEYDWAQSMRDHYAVRYLSAVSKLVKSDIVENDLAAAQKRLIEAHALFPLDDELNKMLLELYGLKKDKTALVAHYRDMEQRYRSELDIKPGKALQTIYKQKLQEL